MDEDQIKTKRKTEFACNYVLDCHSQLPATSRYGDDNEAYRMTANAQAVWKETLDLADKHITQCKILLSNFSMWALAVNQSVL